MVQIDLHRRFQERATKLSIQDRALVESALNQLQQGFGQPHLHSGLGVRRLRKKLFECRAGLELRILFWAEKGVLTAYDVMRHDQIQAFLRRF